jgi:hypothetical protein
LFDVAANVAPGIKIVPDRAAPAARVSVKFVMMFGSRKGPVTGSLAFDDCAFLGL